MQNNPKKVLADKSKETQPTN